VGLVACFLSGIIEALGGTFAGWVRRVTPRAALLSTLAGIAVGFISMEFLARSFDRPLVAMVPLGILLVTYFSRVRLPGGLPGGLLAVAAGTGLAWILHLSGYAHGATWGGEVPRAPLGFYPPRPALGGLWEALTDPQLRGEIWGRISIILPMGLINVLGSLQNVESAEAEGDSYPTGPSLVVNGVGSMAAACFGSCFPTTIYIGHPGWKRMGARWGYSVLNGIFFTLVAFTGLMSALARAVPIEAAMAILVWIAIVITAQAFSATPRRHGPAVVLGLLPGLAAWGWLMIESSQLGFKLQGALAWERPLGELVQDLSTSTLPYVEGILTLRAGFMFTGVVLAAMGVYLIERRFLRAAVWAGLAAAFTLAGVMHSYSLGATAVAEEIRPGLAWEMAAAYLALAAIFALAGVLGGKGKSSSGEARADGEV
jgi:AGZA family xanthine/uracil permease-like MFS transporter